MDFQFAPWERLTSEVTDGDANFQFDSSRQPEWLPRDQEFHWLVRRCGLWVWLRDRARPPGDWNHWLFCPPVLGNDRPTAEYWGNFVYMLDPARVGTFVHRLWVLRVNPFFVVLWNSGAGWHFTENSLVEFGQTNPTARWEFQPQMAGLERMPSSEVYRLLRADWTNPNSDLRQTARVANRHATLGQLERELLHVETRIGTPQRFVALMRAALRCFDPQWLEDGVNVELGAKADGRLEIHLRNEYGTNFAPFEWALLHSIVGVLEPRLLAINDDMSSGLRALLNAFGNRMFIVSVSKPSMHERLEAAHELRPWLKENRLESLWNFDGNF